MAFAKYDFVLTFVISILISFVYNYNHNNIVKDNRERAYNDCINQITQIGKINISFNGMQAFEHSFRNLGFVINTTLQTEILNQYINYLYMAVNTSYDLKAILSPLEWCLANMSSKIIIPTLNWSSEHEFCKKFLSNANFLYILSTEKAFYYGYYNEVFTNNNNDTKHIYYTYMIEKFLSFGVNPTILGPQQYCNEYPALLCIEKISNSQGINSEMSAAQVFEYAYRNLILKNMNRRKTGYLYHYVRFLLDQVISSCDDNVFKNPEQWCDDKSLYKPVPDIIDIETICFNELKKEFPKYMNNGISALSKVYLNTISTSKMNAFTRLYYSYMLNKILSHIESSNPWSIKNYCNHFFTLTIPTSTDDLSQNVNTTEFSNDQQETDYIDVFGDDLDKDPYNSWLGIEKTFSVGENSNIDTSIDEYQADQDKYWPFNQSS